MREEEQEKAWKKREDKWEAERMARERLMKEVNETRKIQIEEKKHIQARQKAEDARWTKPVDVTCLLMLLFPYIFGLFGLQKTRRRCSVFNSIYYTSNTCAKKKQLNFHHRINCGIDGFVVCAFAGIKTTKHCRPSAFGWKFSTRHAEIPRENTFRVQQWLLGIT